jgi:hypothetical protein
LKKEIQERVNPAGVVIEEAVSTTLLMLRKLPRPMLKRQQAEAKLLPDRKSLKCR